MRVDELYPDNFQDVREALVVQNDIDVLPVIFDKLFRSKLASMFVFVLQLV